MTLKQKNRTLLLGILLLLFVAYQFAFKKTIEVRSEYTKLNQEKKQMEKSQEELGYLSRQNIVLDSILSSNDLSVERSYEQTLLQKIDQLREKYKVKILSITEPHNFKTEAATVESYTIEVQGDFRDLMLFSSDLEKLRLGSFLSVDFSKKKNIKTRKIEIICSIVLQRLST